MPDAPGTGMTRRRMLAASAGLALAVYGADKLGLPGLDDGIAQAAQASGPKDPVLVSIFLDGGADSLAILGKPGDGAYRKARPTLGVKESGKAWLGDWRFSEPASALADLHQAGQLAVAPSIGYGDADQSHFTSRHFWQAGATDAHLRTGWLGRYLDRHGVRDNPLQGLALGGMLSPQLATASAPVSSVSDPTSYDFWTPGVWGEHQDRMLDSLADLAAAAGGHDEAGRAYQRAAGGTHQLRRQLSGLGEKITSPVAYPAGGDNDDLPKRLAAVAAMLSAGMPLRCVSVDYGTFDTHDAQNDKLGPQIKLLAETLRAFQADLAARGLADRVLVHVWSEFGRRPQENAGGTDHGAAGLSLLVGSRVRPQSIGEPPSLTRFDTDGNLRPTSDFRGLYCAILEQWLGVDAGPIIPGASRFGRPTLLK